jgi:hypothetical protein
MRAALLWVFPGLLFWAAACLPHARPDARGTLRAWVEAVERDDPAAAWRLVSAEARKGTNEADFTRRWKELRGERHDRAADLKRVTAPPAESARVQVGQRAALVVHEPAGWRVLSPRLERVGASSPEEALARFVRALEARDFDAALQLLGEPLRSSLERELAERLSRLRPLVGKPIPADGNRARIRYDTRYLIELIHENGAWQIHDLN